MVGSPETIDQEVKHSFGFNFLKIILRSMERHKSFISGPGAKSLRCNSSDL